MEGCSCAATDDCLLLLCLEVSESSLDLEFTLLWPLCLEELEVVEVDIHNTALDCRSVDVNDVGDLGNKWPFGLLGGLEGLIDLEGVLVADECLIFEGRILELGEDVECRMIWKRP